MSTINFSATKNANLLSGYPDMNRTNMDVQATRKWIVTFDTTTATVGTVTSARLYFYGDGYSAHTIYLRTLTEHTDWVENQATWNIYKTGSSWNTPGATFSADISSSAVSTPSGWWYFDITGLAFNTVYNWGFIATGGYFDGAVRGGANAPYLQITYTPIVNTGASLLMSLL